MYQNYNVPIECIVGQYFLRVLKNHKLFNKFKVKYNIILNKKCSRDDGENNFFSDCRNWNDVCLKVGKLAEKDYAKNRRDGTRYEFVTLIINHLLHEFIELTRIMNPRELGRLGQEIFDLSCYAAYGDEFIEDMEIMRQEMGGMMPTNDYEARMMAEFAHFKQNGGNLSFEDFAKRFKKNNPIEEYQPSGRVGDNGSSDVEYDNYDDDDDIEAEQLLNHNDDYFLF